MELNSVGCKQESKDLIGKTLGLLFVRKGCVCVCVCVSHGFLLKCLPDLFVVAVNRTELLGSSGNVYGLSRLCDD